MAVNSPALPNVGGAIGAWAAPLEFMLVGKEQRDFQTVEVLYPKRARGIRAPLKAQEIAMKPEGERAWRWEAIHCTPSLQLRIDDVVIFAGVRYRVTGKKDYAEYGYLEYEILQDFNA
jgi:hypothetical protein